MKTLLCGRFTLDLSRPLLMGILNVTPDSFSDGGRFSRVDAALARAEAMLAEGADILDIGGESTRPGAPFVSPEEEMDRVLPVLEQLRGIGAPLSLDTRRAAVMREAIALDAVDLINDVSALEDEGALALAAGSQAAICLMHKQGNPDSMQDKPAYEDVVAEVAGYLQRRVQLCLDAGIARERLLVDPGFGFGKTLAHNLALLKRLDEIERIAGVPQLVGLSRKSMLGAITGEETPAERLGASVAAALESARRGAAVIRAHDVKATRQALQLWQALRES
ncbi:dihydropteroate synthase [Chromobacterium subtsugae]|uniref:Dihydropteroate synthase n=1 Tax=Chromobacterium subtsugae TaxID=251747 RepID=A0ABS7FGI7_9NEIS|nr:MULTISPECIES: dihydropteroate synthase [Chromobacterium]KUM05031.1 dihydropteroate synthase [Chromobacterium subtsugae]KZE86338.1 dihydropteroate synthase [Chromobacterium sp. F49]MBW7567961.1 dihydropteroate synthase [Chromobacterium subtsugae]MBW8289188.1 dihydropteroate synthase [Chromobacterium subtsugae]WSE92670.1 dihydropteroate synthase [Chromobacterium subtsugae]